MNPEEAWNIAYTQLELQFDRASFDTWLRGATLLNQEGSLFRIGVRNSYARDMLQHRLYRSVRRVLSDVCGEDVELQFEVNKPFREVQSSEPDMPLFQLLAQQPEDDIPTLPIHARVSRPQLADLPECELNPRYTFERFMVNGSNQVTYQAARAIAENPGRSYNPFLVYGGVGLGKTHLLQAIAHVCQGKGLRVMYIPSEVFTNELIDSIRRRTTPMFREKYRSLDVLLVDDIQFIAGKDSTQEEFFHTFNALYTFTKQIVLASDRHPQELTTLEARLRSRFEGGLASDVQPLELETRLAILKMWMQERSVHLSEPVLEMIAQRAPSNVRELEGVFNQMVAKARLSPLTYEAVEETFDSFERPRHYGQRVTLDMVLEATAAYFHLKARDLTGKSRAGRINQARQIAMYLTRELTNLSLSQIGEVFGGRSHTTVLHGCNKIAEEMDFDNSLRSTIKEIRDVI